MSDDFDVVDVQNKPVEAPKPPPAEKAKPRDFLLDISRHGINTTQEYESELKRDQMFHMYEQRGYACRARNRKPAATAAETA
jgi:hypothetical protein